MFAILRRLAPTVCVGALVLAAALSARVPRRHLSVAVCV